MGVGAPQKPPVDADEPANLARGSTTEAAASRSSLASSKGAASFVASGIVESSPSTPAREANQSGDTISPIEGQLKQTNSRSSNGLKPLTAGNTSATGRQGLPKASNSAVADPALVPVTVHREPSRSTVHSDDSGRHGGDPKGPHHSKVSPATDVRLPPTATARDDSPVVDLGEDSLAKPRASAPTVPPIQTHHLRHPSGASSLLSPQSNRRQPRLMDDISRARSPAQSVSRDSSLSGAAGDHTQNISSANSVSGNSISQSRALLSLAQEAQGTSDHLSVLDRKPKQILSKDSWMKDDTVKECFMCQQPFTAFRRKHHCRTCGCIFDAKCTTVISGETYGVPGSLRVCNRCLIVITRRFDGSGSEDSGDEQSFMPRFFGASASRTPGGQSRSKDHEWSAGSHHSDDTRPVNNTMMANPAARRVREPNRTSSILETDSTSLSRPGSSRSLQSLGTGRPQSSAGHKRHQSKHSMFGRFKPPQESRAPFRKAIEERREKQSKFPAFHDDNIIDPELADYMSDESSEDEQMGIFSTMATTDLQPNSYENDKANAAPFLNRPRRQGHRPGEKSISGMTFAGHHGNIDDVNGPASILGNRRANRRRNLSSVGGSVHHAGSPRPKSAVYKGASMSTEFLFPLDSTVQTGSQLTQSDSSPLPPSQTPELSSISLRHVERLLHQLLDDIRMPNPMAWQKALIPILLQSTDDISLDVDNDFMDIRHYVKLKKIPGGRPGDTSYVSGVVFTKNLALKSMPRRVSNPRIMLVTFPIEYQRHQQHFMSLQPVLEQEKEFLRVVVQRITSRKPHVLLAEKGVSGVALQYLSEANIAVAYNVKHAVIEAVSRCAETEIVSSLDMLALPVHVGHCASFEVRTFVNNDHPGRKKSYIFLSGCKPSLGCTIALRGADVKTLSRIKHIVEFMVYVVYNLKLESSLLKDEAIEPSEASGKTTNSSLQGGAGDNLSLRGGSLTSTQTPAGPTMIFNQPSSGESEPPSQVSVGDSSLAESNEGLLPSQAESEGQNQEQSPVSMHEGHAHDDPDGPVPDDAPMPTYYSDVVAKYETKILSASPYVKFKQPYLLMKAREQERRLLYLKRLRDQDTVSEKGGDVERTGPQKFQLIKPEMVEEIGPKAPRQIMEILRAVHDAEYDKALFNYKTQTRQWELYIQGNLDLFDPLSHQNIVVLHSVICTETKIACIEPNLMPINFYDEQRVDTGMDPDCTVGQYIEDLIDDQHVICTANGCEREMLQHHRTYVHDDSRITVFVEHAPNDPAPRSGLGDGITMWTYCKSCKKDSEESLMSDTTYKYSFGKYLELLYWGRGLKMTANPDCPHGHYRDHIRYFSLNESRVRIHWDPIELLEIVAPRPRITWKVTNDLKLKNEVFSKMESRWAKFMTTVKGRLESIRIDSVLPVKAESCKAELDRLFKRAQSDQQAITKRLQDIYVNSKYYEVVPFNAAVREMFQKASEWDQSFAKFESDFLGDKDMRQLTMMQLKKMFTDNESKESITLTDGTASTVESEERTSQTFTEPEDKTTQPTEYSENSLEASLHSSKPSEELQQSIDGEEVEIPAEVIERVEPLDLASSPVATRSSQTLVRDSESEAISGASVSQSPELTRIPDSVYSLADGSQSLIDRVDQKRREQNMQSEDSTAPSTPNAERASQAQVPDRGSSRRLGTNISPPMVRAISQPARPMSRTQSTSAKTPGIKDSRATPASGPGGQAQEATVKVDKKLSDRLGLSALKSRKNNSSGIPRPAKKRESKVSTLARHFEQLSREFEKERIRDRKQRAAFLRQPRAMLPRTSTKAVVEVYGDLKEFEELLPPGDHGPGKEGEPVTHPQKLDERAELPTPNEQQPPQPTERQEHDTEKVQTSQPDSDDEGGTSDGEASVSEEYLADIKEIADSSTEIPLELPKHQKKSLMKYLTTFWAERSASGWEPLDYPVNSTDHIFPDSNIIVREDEPSSVIALALSSDDYQDKLLDLRAGAQPEPQGDLSSGSDVEPKSPPSDDAHFGADETELERILGRETDTHLKYSFKDGSALMTCKIFYAKQFDALRQKCGISERIIESLARCLKWNSQGGRTNSVFLKTLDDRFVLKVR